MYIVYECIILHATIYMYMYVSTICADLAAGSKMNYAVCVTI